MIPVCMDCGARGEIREVSTDETRCLSCFIALNKSRGGGSTQLPPAVAPEVPSLPLGAPTVPCPSGGAA